MALKHFLLTIPLGSLLTTFFFYYAVPFFNLHLDWHEAFAVLVGINMLVTILAYVLMPPAVPRPRLRRPPAAVFSSR